MALFDADYDVNMAKGYVEQAEAYLRDCKANRDRAKANGNYKNSPKSYRNSDGKLGNSYDANVWNAENTLKKRKAELARAKEKAKEAKERERERKKVEKAPSKSSSSRSSSSYSSYSDDSSDYSSSYSSSSSESISDDRSTPSEYVPRSWRVTLILCLLFGWLGLHRFYVGKTGTGILQLLTLGGYGLWAFIDLVCIALGVFKDAEGHIIRSEFKL